MEKTYKEIVLESHALALLLIGCGYVPHCLNSKYWYVFGR